jgi:hypothetical protein
MRIGRGCERCRHRHIRCTIRKGASSCNPCSRLGRVCRLDPPFRFRTVHHVYQKSHGTASKFDLVWDPHQTWVKTPASCMFILLLHLVMDDVIMIPVTFVLESADDSAEWETDAPQDSHDEAPPSEQIPPTPRAVFPDISSLLIPGPTRSYDEVVGNHQLDVPVPTPSIPDETQLILPSSTAISPTVLNSIVSPLASTGWTDPTSAGSPISPRAINSPKLSSREAYLLRSFISKIAPWVLSFSP